MGDGISWVDAVTSENDKNDFSGRCLLQEMDHDRAVRCGCLKIIRIDDDKSDSSTLGAATKNGYPEITTMVFDLCDSDGNYINYPNETPEKNICVTTSCTDNSESMLDILSCFEEKTSPNRDPDFTTKCTIDDALSPTHSPNKDPPDQPTQLPTTTQTGGKKEGDDCNTHSECLATLYCKKKCKNKKKEGKNCKGINEYCLSELCGEAKTCVTTAKPTQLPTTTQTGGKEKGDECDTHSECLATLYCKKKCKNEKKEGKNCKGINEYCLSELCGDTQTCVTDANPTQLPTTTQTGGKKKVGDDCNSPSDCESTLFCKDQCKKKKGEGQKCKKNVNCLSELCGGAKTCVTNP